MKETIKKNKKYIIIGVVIIILLLIGIAFAYLTTTLQGDKEYLVRAGTLDLVLDEGNELTLEKQIPLEDSEGMKLDGFNFSLVNNGKIDTDYTIYLDDMELSNGEKRMPDSSIRYSLTRNDETFMTRNMTTMGSNPNRRVDFGTISPDETINYTLRIWIDYDATTEEASGKVFKGKLRVVGSQSVGEEASTVLLDNISKENQYDDGVDTFITGENPDNYIWYSGKLWRAVSVNNEEKTVKLVTQWNISTINYSSGSTAFEGSYMEEWLNDTSVDGFLGNLRDYENFIVTDALWDATMDDRELGNITRPNGTTTVSDSVGLLNVYEYQSSYNGTTYSNGYLNNGLYWRTLTPYSSSGVRYLISNGNTYYDSPSTAYGVRPSINLKSNVKIVSGSGTEDDPYHLEGDNDTNLSGTLLNTRYSGEYIRFGTGENNLYRIVSHENGSGTKIVSAEPLKDSGVFMTSAFGDNVLFSSANTIGTFLNREYLTNYVDNTYGNMIEDSTTWYLGTVDVATSYKLAKYTDETTLTSSTTTSKIGLLRIGELMSGQFERYSVKGESSSSGLTTTYWTLTPNSMGSIRCVSYDGSAVDNISSNMRGIRPSLNLKSNVIITNGIGTKEDPFEISLEN